MINRRCKKKKVIDLRKKIEDYIIRDDCDQNSPVPKWFLDISVNCYCRNWLNSFVCNARIKWSPKGYILTRIDNIIDGSLGDVVIDRDHGLSGEGIKIIY